jgi:hypothetical protein
VYEKINPPPLPRGRVRKGFIFFNNSVHGTKNIKKVSRKVGKCERKRRVRINKV